MTESQCPFCSIPEREELLYEDDLVFLVPTLDMKGHKIRIMIATKRHTTEPTFHELTTAFAVLFDYMNALSLDEWYLVDSIFGRWPDHWHYVICDKFGTTEELELFAKTPKVKFPLRRVMIGIPTFNEEKNIANVIVEARKYGAVVVYDDGSTDKTVELSNEAGAHVIMGEVNRGYGVAIKRLFEYAQANYDILITLDGDGQHDPSEIPLFLSSLFKSDVVIGNRFLGSSDTPKYREVVIRGINLIMGLGDSQCGFRAYNKKAIHALHIVEEGMGASIEILRKSKENKLKISEVPCTITYENTEHTQNPVTQGMILIETLFWGVVWKRPYTVLGIPALLSFICALYFGAGLINLYRTSGVFVLSYGLLTGGFLGLWLVLCLATFIITIQRRMLRELEAMV